MTSRPAIAFVSLTAGLAPLALALSCGALATPPIARQGHKTESALAILAAMGLTPGEGARRVILADSDPGVRQLLHGYTRPETLQRAGREMLPWLDEDSDQTWAALRRGVGSGSAEHELARWLWLQHQTMRRRPLVVRSGEYWTVANPAGLSRGGTWQRAQRRDCHDIRRVVERLIGCAFCAGHGWAYMEGLACPACGGAPPSWQHRIPAEVLDDARAVPVPMNADGWFVYIDPTYTGTDEYPGNMAARDAVEMGRAWHAAGAVVCLSSGQRLDVEGWHAQRISEFAPSRRGDEWVTLSRPTRLLSGSQSRLFGGAA